MQRGWEVKRLTYMYQAAAGQDHLHPVVNEEQGHIQGLINGTWWLSSVYCMIHGAVREWQEEVTL